MFAILAPLMCLILWKHSLGACTPGTAGTAGIDPERYVQTQADIVVQGLLKQARAVKA